MFILLLLVELGVLVCFVIVLIKQFQNAGAVHGIIGIITCTIWTFIWGWMNATKLNIRNVMLAWTGLILLCIVFQFVFGASMLPYYGTPPVVTP